MSMRALALLFLGFAGLYAQAPCKVLVVTGLSDSLYHHWERTTPVIADAIRQTGRCEVRMLEEPRAMNAAALQGYQTLLLNYNGPRLGAQAEAAIENFVRNGGGLIAFHLGLYGTFYGQVFGEKGPWKAGPAGAGWKAYGGMLGASWKPENIGHSLRHAFPVKWEVPEHPVAAGMPAEFTANDELYHKIDLRPGVQVLATAFNDTAQRGTGKREPIVWTNTFGKGRVLVTTLGHDEGALYQPGVQNLFARAVEWTATGAVTTKPLDLFHSNRAPGAIRVLAVTGGHSYPVGFYAALESMRNVSWTHANGHNEAFRQPTEKRFDVVLLHDMYNEITPQAQERLKSFLEAGGGVIQLHHAIVNYTSWPWWFQEVTGGKYFEKEQPGYKKSSFHEDIEFSVVPVKGKEKHPVLEGVGPLSVYDEFYKDRWHSDKIEVLMESKHPGNDPPVVWVGPYRKARVLTIQIGHSDHTLRNPAFQRLLHNAIEWVARKR